MKEEDAISLLVNSECSQEVIDHCKAVAEYARDIAINISKCSKVKKNSQNIDIDLVYLGGLLHDIGRSRTHGIEHAVEGAKIARENGLDNKLVNIIERHIGAGITIKEAVELGLSEKDYRPVTIEEKIVAHADNLVAGTRVATIEELISKLQRKNIKNNIIRRIIELNNEICVQMCH